MGFRRNLATWEIVDQVMQVRDDSPHPVRGVVFMGMGEPMLNYDRVHAAPAEILSEPCGLAIDAQAITISTVGIVPMIRRFTAERRPYRLIVSLTAADHAKRRRLLPVEETHPLPELMAAVRDYHAATGRARDAGLDAALGRQHAAGGRPAAGRADGGAAGADRPDRRERRDGPIRAAAGRRAATPSATP